MSKKFFQILTFSALGLTLLLSGNETKAVECKSVFDTCRNNCPDNSCGSGEKARNYVCATFGKTENNAAGAIACQEAWKNNEKPFSICALSCLAMKKAGECTGCCM